MSLTANRNVSYLPQGLTTGTIAKTIDIGTAAANFSIGTIPAGSVVASVAVKNPQTISATTAVKFGIGRLTATADPDKYWLSTNLAATNVSKTLLDTAASVSAAEEIALFACDTNGAAAGTIGGTGQTVDVLITYITAETL
jgi:hypothetical protein